MDTKSRTKQATVETQNARSLRSLLASASRTLARIAFLTVAIGVHHLWFGIGPHGMLPAMMDGAVLAVLCMASVYVWNATKSSSVHST